MKQIRKVVVSISVAMATLAGASAQTGANVYVTTNLVANVKGLAPLVDPNLVDPWGNCYSATSPFWVSDHLSGKATVYNGQGTASATVGTIPPGSASAAGALGRPTGQVRNNTAGIFKLANGNAASFIFSTDDGTISAWNGGTVAQIMADNSASKAVYKGLAIGTNSTGAYLYAPNFRSGKIEVYDSTFAPATLAGNFTDPGIASGFAPFNIWNLNNNLYVTYAKQDASQFLDVAGPGNGYVSVFDLNGNLVNHLVNSVQLFQTPVLNSPWGVAIAPANWGAFGGALIVGNFGDGRINAFNLTNGKYLGTLQDANGNPLVISGLWALLFGNGGSGGDVNTLYFTAGVPNGSTVARGIIGSIAPPAAITSVVNAASQLSGAVAPGEIVKISGQTVGPSPAVSATIPPASGALATTLGGTSVTVNGTAAPILYTNGTQTNIQIPYEVSGASTANFVLTTGTQTANFSTPVAATAPGLFTIDFSGTNQLVALNADGTVNSSKNPASRGTTIWLFATGAGLTSPTDKDGASETDSSRVPVAPVSLTIGGVSAVIGTDGSTPKDVSGVLEVMATVPASIQPGSAAVVLTSGVVATTQATVVYVR